MGDPPGNHGVKVNVLNGQCFNSILVPAFGCFQETAALAGGHPGILGLLFCFLDGKQDPSLDTQPCQGCAVRKDCLAPGVPHTVLHGVFYIENQGNPHPVFVQQSGVCLPLRMALDGTFRIRAYICAGNIRKVILPAEGSLGAHLTSHGNTHARSCLCPQFAERTAFPFR